MEHLPLLPMSLALSGLCVVVGVRILAYAAFRIGSDDFWGWSGCALGCILGGSQNLMGTWKSYRQLEGSAHKVVRRSLTEKFYRSSEPGSGDGWALAAIAAFGLLFYEAGELLVWQSFGDDFRMSAGVVLMCLAGPILFAASFALAACVMVRWRVRPDEDEARQPGPSSAKAEALPPGLVPKLLMLSFGSLVGPVLILAGAGRMGHGLITYGDFSFAFWGGVEVGLGGLLATGGGLFGARKKQWRWAGWITVMEDWRWNWFDTLALGFMIPGMLAVPLPFCFSGALPWAAANALQHLVFVFAVQWGLFVMVRAFIRAAQAPSL